MANTISDALLEKLRKVKALADDAKDEAEGTAALLAFQRLLSKNGLSEQEVQIELDGEDDADVNRVESLSRAKLESWQVSIHAAMAEHFRCKSMITNSYASGRRVQILKYVGMVTDPLLATEAFKSAIAVVSAMWKKKKKEYMGRYYNETAARNSYMIGFRHGMVTAFKEQEAKKELGLILVRDKRVDESMADLKKVRNRRVTVDGSGLREAGFTDGNNFGKGNALGKSRVAGAIA